MITKHNDDKNTVFSKIQEEDRMILFLDILKNDKQYGHIVSGIKNTYIKNNEIHLQAKRLLDMFQENDNEIKDLVEFLFKQRKNSQLYGEVKSRKELIKNIESHLVSLIEKYIKKIRNREYQEIKLQ